MDGGACASCPRDGANWEATKSTVCTTPSSRSGICEMRLETIPLNQDAASCRRNAESVGKMTDVGVLKESASTDPVVRKRGSLLLNNFIQRCAIFYSFCFGQAPRVVSEIRQGADHVTQKTIANHRPNPLMLIIPNSEQRGQDTV